MSEVDQVQSDGRTVWVHDAEDGSCIGRFGWQGIDIHRPLSEQSEKGQCLFCTHGPTGLAEWQDFVSAMDTIYGVTVSEHHRPKHIETVEEE
ncbi:hypothetical protein [Sphingomonas sp. 3-13AW]|uniref:hypothetical protein n=1 Tax=Sphingomonas sp. 3-13AW TaxID=3050450 RepID=UPI003BB75EE6